MTARAIRIRGGDIELDAELDDTETARLVYDALPIRGAAQRWGEEIYLPIAVEAQSSPDARDVMEVGELGYWPPGSAFCIFFGPTPASERDEPRAASEVNPLGRVLGDATVLTRIPHGTEIILEKR